MIVNSKERENLLSRLMSLTVSYHQRRRLQLADRQQIEDARDRVRAD